MRVRGVQIVVVAVSAVTLLAAGCSAEPDRLTAQDRARQAARRSTTTTEPGYVPRFVAGPCDPERVPPAPAVVDCGTLVVPEDRARPQGRQVRLPVSIVRATQPRQPDPIVYFSGGPGNGGVQAGRTWARLPLAPDRDVITFDQRGTGAAEPSLDCPEVDAATFAMFETAEPPAEEAPAMEAAYLACRSRLVGEGIDLDAYDTPTVARDVADLRTALGIDEWNLFGISYGTTVAMEVLRSHPEGVRSAVLDSVYPPDAVLGAATFDDAARAFDVLVEGCAADEDCAAAHPDLAAELDAAVERLDEEPFLLDIEVGEETVQGRFTGTDLIGGLFNALYDTALIPLLPLFIGEVARGNQSLLSDVAVEGIRSLVQPAEAQTASVECADRQSIVDQAAVRRAIEEHPRYGLIAAVRPLPQLCPDWDVASVPAGFHRIPETDVPTLVFGNEYDPVTPPAQSRHAAEELGDAATFVLFPGLGHGATDAAPCPLRIFQAFVADPRAALDVGCAGTMPPPPFLVTSS